MPDAPPRALSLRLHQPARRRQPQGLVRPKGLRGDRQAAQRGPEEERAGRSRPRVHVELPRPVRERRLPYDFTFRGDDDREYRFHGQKDVTMIALHDTMTTLPASLYDADGKEVGRAVLRFDVRGDLVKFLRSWKLWVPAWSA